MQERIFLQADVNKHGLETHLDIFDLTLVNAADDIARAVALDAVFLQPAILQKGHARFEFFDAENEFVARLARKTQKLSYFVYHKIVLKVDRTPAELPRRFAGKLLIEGSSRPGTSVRLRGRRRRRLLLSYSKQAFK